MDKKGKAVKAERASLNGCGEKCSGKCGGSSVTRPRGWRSLLKK